MSTRKSVSLSEMPPSQKTEISIPEIEDHRTRLAIARILSFTHGYSDLPPPVSYKRISPKNQMDLSQAISCLQNFTDESLEGSKCRISHRCALDIALIGFAHQNYKSTYPGQTFFPNIRVPIFALKVPRKIVDMKFPTYRFYGVWKDQARILVGLIDGMGHSLEGWTPDEASPIVPHERAKGKARR